MNDLEAVEELSRIARKLESQDEFDEAVADMALAFKKLNNHLANDPKYRKVCERNRALIVKVAQMGAERQQIKTKGWNQIDPASNN